jgi:hypothetical protein
MRFRRFLFATALDFSSAIFAELLSRRYSRAAMPLKIWRGFHGAARMRPATLCAAFASRHGRLKIFHFHFHIIFAEMPLFAISHFR